MQPKILAVIKKELSSFFASPMAFLFLAVYLASSLFIFFWVEAFFARNIADVRPLFDWMPILLGFLSAALTMRLWSEERKLGTTEFLLTKPVAVWQIVIGKFIACWLLIGLAVFLTIFLPIMVSFLGNIDWGVVTTAYLATLFLAAAYLAIGLTVSANTDNQIVSLIISSLVCMSLYLLGSDLITNFFGNGLAQLLRLLGSGSRFAAISRGILDIRDVYYYCSIVFVFLYLNIVSLERLRGQASKGSRNHIAWLLITNVILSNVILHKLSHNYLRIDLTRGHRYSISTASKQCLSQLQEPLLIRGYFSSKSHPLLAPLVPQLRDLLSEYAQVAGSKVRLEFVDPSQDAAAEAQANEKYGLKPVPFQVADRHQATIVSAYFDIVLQYGDQFEVLNFRDLVEVKAQNEMKIEVLLRNPEYELTRVLKKMLRSYQTSGNVYTAFAQAAQDTLKIVAYVSAVEKLPKELTSLKQAIDTYLIEQSTAAAGKLQLTSHEPEANAGAVAKDIGQKYGFTPMRAHLLDPKTFYFYYVLQFGDQVAMIALPEDLSIAGFKRNFMAAIKRLTPGFMRTVALYADIVDGEANMPQAFYANKKFTALRQKLLQNYLVQDTDLKKGVVPGEADILVVVKPQQLNSEQVFAIDQFLMKGGSVVLVTSPYTVEMAGNTLAANKIDSGLKDWLKFYGITIEDSLVLDKQSMRLALPTERYINGKSFSDYYLGDYPYFIDVRNTGLNAKNMITASIPQLTMAYASAINIDTTKQRERQWVPLIHTSNDAWTNASTQVARAPAPEGALAQYTLAGILQGKFASYFHQQDRKQLITNSPNGSRLIIYAANDFLSDDIIKLMTMMYNELYLSSLQILENSIDWSLEDSSLLTIRSRSNFNQTLQHISETERRWLEYSSYIIAAIALGGIYAGRWFLQKRYIRQQKQKFQIKEKS
jgi:ABC-2 type transport system permease protein